MNGSKDHIETLTYEEIEKRFGTIKSHCRIAYAIPQKWFSWFDMDRWHIREAARLTVCSVIQCLEKCIQEEKRLWPVFKPSCSFFVKVDAIYKIFYSGHRDSYITPHEYIQWASTKQSISLPHEMLEWYKQRAEHVASSTAPTPAQETPQPLANGVRFSAEEQVSPRQAVNDSITIIAWRAAVDEYKATPGRRANDPLPRDMKILLDSLEGKGFALLENENPRRNISRSLKNARENGVPMLKQLYPNLPPMKF